jgi:hypothetical protein
MMVLFQPKAGKGAKQKGFWPRMSANKHELGIEDRKKTRNQEVF